MKPLLPSQILDSLSDSDSVSRLDLPQEVLHGELHEFLNNLNNKGFGTASSEAHKKCSRRAKQYTVNGTILTRQALGPTLAFLLKFLNDHKSYLEYQRHL
ncbi:hypothetical protein ACH5RR_015667 [Cinchona calisaya]|uniref:Uncharacterized protein n=1 Tax=Cinchona calisaya TaxID=153742 RepID=A0ABD2ZV13_9GENT